ncbi:ABC transporter ATP-binding protein [Desulfospira joergensenii]|uniref:ABC transporter ATP-binding protein n=1 Tax=Desulfospira joergensenii TaxID=53329 RepID=UPI0003B6EF1C|nr:ABC transporter ATP-binding protein [Desulfospira joergensenii]
MLKLENIETFYGESQALFGVSLEIGPSEVVTLLGRNGMGKSTTIKSIIGLAPVRSGKILFRDWPIHSCPSHVIARSGIGLVPEGRQIFPNLTVYENMVATAANPTGARNPFLLKDVLSLFPRLKDRMNNYGNQLSGGEQQMLAIARALMINPRLLILDEATEGLAPLIRREIWQALAVLKDRGMSILIVDKNIQALMNLAQRHYIMEKGKIVWTGPTSSLESRPELQKRYIGV